MLRIDCWQCQLDIELQTCKFRSSNKDGFLKWYALHSSMKTHYLYLLIMWLINGQLKHSVLWRYFSYQRLVSSLKERNYFSVKNKQNVSKRSIKITNSFFSRIAVTRVEFNNRKRWKKEICTFRNIYTFLKCQVSSN